MMWAFANWKFDLDQSALPEQQLMPEQCRMHQATRASTASWSHLLADMLLCKRFG